MDSRTLPAELRPRYGLGPAKQHHRGRWLVIALCVLVGLTLVVWIGVHQANPPLRWQNVGYTVDSPQLATVTFDVIKDPDRGARCTLTALSESYAQVGVVDYEVPAAAHRVVRTTVPISTQELATTAVVDHCTLLPAD